MVQSSPGVISTCSGSTTSRTRSLRTRWGFDPQNWQPERPWGTWSRESGDISVFRRAYTRPYVALRTFVGIEPNSCYGLITNSATQLSTVYSESSPETMEIVYVPTAV